MKRKKLNRLSEEEEGAIGIGTLIVFIGLILVAAIASAVIVGVMGDLQERAARTGRETQENVAPPLQVQHAEGEYDGENGFEEMRFVVSLLEGMQQYDPENLMIQVNAEEGSSGRFTNDSDGEGVDGEFDSNAIIGDGDEITRDEMYEISITHDFDDIDTNEALTIKFMAAEGSPPTLFETVTPAEWPDPDGDFELP